MDKSNPSPRNALALRPPPNYQDLLERMVGGEDLLRYAEGRTEGLGDGERVEVSPTVEEKVKVVEQNMARLASEVVMLGSGTQHCLTEERKKRETARKMKIVLEKIGIADRHLATKKSSILKMLEKLDKKLEEKHEASLGSTTVKTEVKVEEDVEMDYEMD